jgi:1-phosphatidylinositol-4-phosphate 5-kinase
MPRLRRRVSLSRATKDETFAIRKAMRESDPKALGSETTKLPDVEPVDDRQYFLFYQDEGGYRATGEFNSPQDAIYYLGIIDICTPYSTSKKLEHFWKGLSADRVCSVII